MAKLRLYLKTAAAAEYLGIHHNTLRKWGATGKIRMYWNPANGYRLFKRFDLDDFLAKAATPVEVAASETSAPLVVPDEQTPAGLTEDSPDLAAAARCAAWRLRLLKGSDAALPSTTSTN